MQGVLGVCLSTLAWSAHGGAKYLLGEPDGPLGRAMVEQWQLKPLVDQSDGVVVVTGAAIKAIAAEQAQALRDSVKAGHAVVLTTADQQALDALHATIGRPVMASMSDHGPSALEAYAYISPKGGQYSLAMHAVGSGQHPLNAEQDRARVAQVEQWFIDANNLASQARTTELDTSNEDITYLLNSWQVKQTFPVTYGWATCDTDVKSCTNTYNIYLNAISLYSETNADSGSGQPTDYFIMQLTEDFSTAGCTGFYGAAGYDNAPEMKAYWAYQYQLTAGVEGLTFDQFSAVPNMVAPPSASNNVSVDTGTTWSLGGSGTAGSANTVSFNAGVSFSNSTSTSYDSMQTTYNAQTTTENSVRWTYNSWDYVSNALSGNSIGTSCNTGDGIGSLSPDIYGGTFTPEQTWIWEADATVRGQVGAQLPVDVQSSVLLGWAQDVNNELFGSDCSSNQDTGNKYSITNADDMHTASNGNSSIVQPTVVFDVPCQEGAIFDLAWGTMPLGALDKDSQKPNGNPGTPHALPTMSPLVPFAPTSVD